MPPWEEMDNGGNSIAKIVFTLFARNEYVSHVYKINSSQLRMLHSDWLGYTLSNSDII